MGLDITAYSHLSYIGHHPLDHEDDGLICGGRYDEDFNRHHVPAYAYAEFPHALMGVPAQRVVDYPSAKFLSAGCFELTGKTESHGFRAGSYTGYGVWRDDLADRYNPSRRPEGWFYELIVFADNEGTICELAAANLLGNFRQFEIEYAAQHEDYMVDRYRDWMRACELAADGGLIDFH